MKRCFATIGFSSAVTLLVLNVLSFEYVCAVTAALALVFVTSLILPKYRDGAVLPVSLASALFSCLIFICVYKSAAEPAMLLSSKALQTQFYITDLPQRTDSGYLYIAKTKAIMLSGAPQELKIRIRSDVPLNIKEFMLTEGRLRFYSVGKTPFSSYGMWGKGIYLTARVEDFRQSDVVTNKLMLRVLELRKSIISSILANIKGDAGALAAALVTGCKTYISNDTYNAFKTAGVSHIMAVSGLHLTVFSGGVKLLLNALKVNKKVSSAVVIALIVFYCALTGFSVSVVRAGIMMGVFLSAVFFNRRGDALNSLGAAVFVICLNPFAPTDSGAVLSVLAVLSLCTAVKAVDKAETKLKKRRFARTFFGETLIYIFDALLCSAFITAFLLPAYYLFFGYCSLIGIFLNVIVIPLGSISTVLSMSVGFLAPVFGGAGVLSAACEAVNNLIIAVVKMSSSFAFSTVILERYFGIVLGVILILIALCFIVRSKTLIRASAVLSAVIIAVSFSASVILNANTSRICVTKSGAVAVCDGENSVVIGVSNKSDLATVKSFLLARDSTVDVLVSPDDVTCTADLSEAVQCEKLVSASFSRELLNSARYKEYETQNDVSGSAGNIEYRIYTENSELKYSVKIKGVTVSNSDGDICVNNGIINDSYGTASLKKGDIIYTVYPNKTYEARRLNLWQG